MIAPTDLRKGDDREQEKIVRVLATLQMILDGSARSRPEVNQRVCAAIGRKRSDKTTMRDLQFIHTGLASRFRGNGRFNAKMFRTLGIIEVLACIDRPVPIAHVVRRVNNVTGDNWIRRTINRDMHALKTMGLVDELPSSVRCDERFYALNHERSKRLLTVAKIVFNESEARDDSPKR